MNKLAHDAIMFSIREKENVEERERQKTLLLLTSILGNQYNYIFDEDGYVRVDGLRFKRKGYKLYLLWPDFYKKGDTIYFDWEESREILVNSLYDLGVILQSRNVKEYFSILERDISEQGRLSIKSTWSFNYDKEI